MTSEPRELQSEVQAPAKAEGERAVLAAYSLYYVGEDIDGVCLYRRQDLSVPLRLRR